MVASERLASSPPGGDPGRPAAAVAPADGNRRRPFFLRELGGRTWPRRPWEVWGRAPQVARWLSWASEGSAARLGASAGEAKSPSRRLSRCCAFSRWRSQAMHLGTVALTRLCPMTRIFSNLDRAISSPSVMRLKKAPRASSLRMPASGWSRATRARTSSRNPATASVRSAPISSSAYFRLSALCCMRWAMARMSTAVATKAATSWQARPITARHSSVSAGQKLLARAAASYCTHMCPSIAARSTRYGALWAWVPNSARSAAILASRSPLPRRSRLASRPRWGADGDGPSSPESGTLMVMGARSPAGAGAGAGRSLSSCTSSSSRCSAASTSAAACRSSAIWDASSCDRKLLFPPPRAVAFLSTLRSACCSLSRRSIRTLFSFCSAGSCAWNSSTCSRISENRLA
mmetsp:Transcript_8828/g.15667  ORF Transcript_8828/g.15667 Transcript_8828/m.15667 type:complete len:405 (-) Transcript_8828:663-1877(-)